MPANNGYEQHAAEEMVRHIIGHIDPEPDRPGLKDTPRRVVESWKELFAGYAMKPDEILKTFDGEGYDEMVLVKDIPLFSHCLAGSTFVDTPRGRIPIQHLRDREWVYCWDESRFQMTLARCKNPRITGRNKRLWRVFTDKDTILCTKNHKFLTYNRGWVRADELVLGDSVVALNRGTKKTNGITRPQLVWTGKQKQIPEHRFVYQETHNTEVDSSIHIHHKDRNPANSTPSNLKALSGSDHTRLHRLEDGPTGFALFTDDQRKKMKAKQVAGVKASQTLDVRAKRAASVQKYWDSLTPAQRAERNHRVLSVERTEWKEDVWCMDIPNYENFVANGMVVHNCEHHVAPIFGVAHVAYIPARENQYRIFGLSKLARLVDCFARRLTVQERITKDVVEAMIPKTNGAACVVEATHMCVCSRGVNKPGSKTITSYLRGAFFDKPAARAELFSLIRG